MFFFRLLLRYRSLSLLLFTLTFSLLVYGLFTPQVRSGVDLPHLDKCIHFSGFFIVFLLGRFATHRWVEGAYWLFPLIAALLLEYLQGRLVLSRDFSYLDMLANIVGVCAACILWVGLMKMEQFEPTEK